MSTYNCQSCDELRQSAPNLVVNGIGKTECTSLANNTGLSPSGGNDSCTDLDNMNDCLVGSMTNEIKAYGDCEWKKFAKKALENLWTVLKGIICTVCGLWEQLTSIWSAIRKLQCQVNFLFNGYDFHLGEVYADTSKSHIVAGKGVSFLNVSQSGTSSDIGIVYVGGGLARITGSCKFYNTDFTDRDNCYSYDQRGVNPTLSTNKSRKGNRAWVGQNTKPNDGDTKGTELVYEIRILKSEFPQIERFFSGIALNANGGGYHAIIQYVDEGKYAHGQHGQCDSKDGAPLDTGYDRGHRVPRGWAYLQLRITWIEEMNAAAAGTQYTPNGLIGIRINQGKVPC